MTAQNRDLGKIKIRPTQEGDIPSLLEIFENAKRYMRQQGNMEQWAGAYPDAEAVRRDMSEGWSYVVECDGEVVGTFCMMTAPEPTYAKLPLSGAYHTLHRVASNGKMRGVVGAAVAYSHSICPRVCIDTHPDNVAMLRAISNLGMDAIGTITLADGTPRLVFELLS